MRASIALALIAAALIAGGCGSGSDGEPSLTVYLSVPLSGPRAADGRDVVDGARLALADAGGEAGGIAIDLEVLDDANGSGWDAAITGANARTATEDSTAIANIGELDSGACRTSIPITNQAGLLQVSPGAGAEDLTRASPLSNDVPDLQASGERSFARVIPSDRDQGEAAAVWMSTAGISAAALRSDGSAYADSLIDGFEAAPAAPVISHDGPALFVASADPSIRVDAATDERSIYGSDAQLDRGAALGSRSTPVRLTSAALDPSQLPAAADGFLAAFTDRYGRDPGRYAAYGYEATAAVLAAIGAADDPTNRGAVIDAFFAIEDRDSILGRYSIDGVGDTTLRALGAYEVGAGGQLRPAPEPLVLP